MHLDRDHALATEREGLAHLHGLPRPRTVDDGVHGLALGNEISGVSALEGRSPGDREARRSERRPGRSSCTRALARAPGGKATSVE